jgi:hypothetical protein
MYLALIIISCFFPKIDILENCFFFPKQYYFLCEVYYEYHSNRRGAKGEVMFETIFSCCNFIGEGDKDRNYKIRRHKVTKLQITGFQITKLQITKLQITKFQINDIVQTRG